jgi:hypothetical protein
MLVRLLAATLIVTCLFAGPVKAQEKGLEALRTYCLSDVKRLCPGIEPGGGRILNCLKANKMGVSLGCAQALKKLKGKAK